MINLLPEYNARVFKRMYLLRLLSVSLLALAVLVIIHSVLLVPTYVFLQAQILNQNIEKEFLSKTLVASGSNEVEARLSALNEKIILLNTLPQQPTFISAIEEILEVSRTGIQVTQISYTPYDPKTHIGVRGIATDRDALRSFAQRLETRDGVAAVEFPIGNLSKDKDLPFTISIVLES